MKNLLLIVATASLCSAAFGADPFSRPQDEIFPMLYFERGFGGDQSEAAMTRFGLRFAKPYSIDSRDLTGVPLGLWRPYPVADLQFTGLGRSSVMLNGAVMWDSFEESAAESSTVESFSNPLFWIGSIVVIGGVLCLAKELICEDSRGGGTSGGSPGLPGASAE